MSTDELVSCDTCKNSVPAFYNGRQRRVCILANKLTFKCIRDGRQSYVKVENSDEKHN